MKATNANIKQSFSDSSFAQRTGKISDANSLNGKRILVTAYDLEQSEHRGIAVYSKAVIHALHNLGAEVWLLTEFAHALRSSGMKRLPSSTRSMIRSARILDALVHGDRGINAYWIANKIPLPIKVFFNCTSANVLNTNANPKKNKLNPKVKAPWYFPSATVSNTSI